MAAVGHLLREGVEEDAWLSITKPWHAGMGNSSLTEDQLHTDLVVLGLFISR